MLKKLKTTIIAALVAVCASPVLGDTVTFNGATINYTNASVTRPDGDGGDIVFKFTTTGEDAGSITLPSYAAAQILVVGGGGGGGCVTQNADSVGGGGGGGGGGFVEASGVTLSGGTYAITVGSGGAGAANDSAAPGGNGGDSKIKLNDAVLYVAKGGGGGGSEGAGSAGGSGGGGSMAGSATSLGGAGETGANTYGSKGGDGMHSKAGAGGGGAGGVGGDTSLIGINGAGGAGGPGRSSMIEVAQGGEPIFYAGGGGGGTCLSPSIGSGGAGGGGAGGGGLFGGMYEPEQGEDGKGGGGGGGSQSKPGQVGGSGVVIIRISEAMVSDPAIPAASMEFTYTGEAIYAVKPSLALDLTGTYCATNIGTYHCTAVPKAGFAWQGGGNSLVDITWTIKPKEIDYPEAIPTAEFDGQNRVAIASPDESFVFSENSVTNATDAGTYSYTVTFKNENYVWKGAAEGEERAPHTVTWVISSKRVTVPAVIEGLVYNDELQVAVDITQFNVDAYEFVEESPYAYQKKDAGSYELLLRLKNDGGKKNYVWFVDGTETYDNQRREWSIAQAPNAITSLEISGWKFSEGARGNTPVATARWGTPQYKFARAEDAPDEEWTLWRGTAKPNDVGVWWVKAFVPESQNWLGAERTMSFVLWDDPATIFTDSMDISITNYAGTTAISNFPLLVRISEASMPGFTYERAGMNGEAIAFIWGDEMLDYDVDTWDVNGESLVWVKVPEVKGKGTKISMWWNVREGQGTTGSNPGRVWEDYYGVWHFNEEIVSANAGTTKSVDATGNGCDAKPANYGTASWIDEMVSAGGLLGRARRITSTTARAKGPRLEIDNSAALALGTKFTMSGWFKENSGRVVANNYNTKMLVSRKTSSSSDNGWYLGIYPTNTNNRQDRMIHGMGGGTAAVLDTVIGTSSQGFYQQGWAYFSGSFNGTTLGLAGGVSGTYARNSGKVAAPTDNAQALTFGAFIGSSQNLQSFCGEFDEFRLCKLTRSADFQRAEYDTVMNANFSRLGLVAIDGLKRNYWKTEPNVQPRMWEKDAFPTNFTVTLGELADGSAVSNYFYYSRTPDATFTDKSLITEEGLYHAVFVMANPEGYEPIMYDIPLRVIGHEPYSSLGGGENGRVLLMNNDAGIVGSRDAISYQGWMYSIDNDPNVYNTAPTFWECFGNDMFTTNKNINTYNAKDGTNWVFWTQKRLRRLWYLDNCRHGNTFNFQDATMVGGKPTMSSDQNYLPWASTSRSIDMNAPFPALAYEVGQLLMRNIVGAAVYSPCYTNGVGTIYFDAVNGWTYGVDENGYQIVVEIATETKTGDPLSDETRADPDNPEDPYGNVKEWVPVKMYPALVDGTTVTPPAEGVYTNNLDITTGGRLDKFYRIYVPVNRQTAMFRIRRVSRLKPGSDEVPDAYFILFDNIFVSYPAMSADLSPTGVFDTGKGGPQTLGWELATTVPFPYAGATNCHGRAKVEYHTNDGKPDAETAGFVSSARMHYRWRYLNQSFTEWKSADLDPMDGFVSYRPLELPDAAGDVEFWYETQLQAPFYKYADYSGLTNSAGKPLGMPCHNEEISTITNTLSSGTVLPSGGTDWFFRLRSGASEWEGLKVEIEGGTLLDGTYPMTLLEDDMWRALVPVPTNAAGVCTFRFFGENRTAAGATELPGTAFEWGGAVAATNEVPADGQLVEMESGGAEQQFEIDHNANYLEFKVSMKFGTWSVSRAEYQNFNHWHDVVTSNDVFKATYPYSGVDDVSMTTKTMDASGWDVFNGENASWHEPFYLSNYNDPGFPKDVFYQTHNTPNNWNANSVTFVSTLLLGRGETPKNTVTEGVIGAKIRGSGQGSIEFTKSNTPNGIDTVKINARLGQTIDFYSFSYALEAYNSGNYTFVVPATMSQKTRTAGDVEGDMTIGASVSAVACYHPSRGCYEFRVERLYKGTTLRFSLYRWNFVGGVATSELLCTRDMDGAIMWTQETSSTDDNKRANQFYAMLISVDTGTAGKTRVVCGLASTAAAPDPAISANSMTTKYLGGSIGYRGLAYDDTSASRHTKGSYGVGSKDCLAEFLVPFHLSLPIEKALQSGNTIAYQDVSGGKWFDTNNKLKVNPPGSTYTYGDDRLGISNDEWVIVPGRCECYSNKAHASQYINSWVGLRTPTTLSQTLEIYLQPKSTGGQWQRYGKQTISGYAFKEYTFPLHLAGQWNMRIQTGPDNMDLAIKTIKQSQWQAPDHEDLDYTPDDFVYTQGIVSTNKTAKRMEITLQPSRGLPTKPFSIRSPLLHGLGKASFSYVNANSNAVVLVQIATNNVINQLTGAHGYNQSIVCVEPGQPLSPGAWTTVAKYGAGCPEPLGTSGTKSLYLGLHDQPDKPVEGMFRIVVAPAVAERAAVVATNDTKDIVWGTITITGMTVSDEPGISDRSWIGYNLRGIGDSTDKEKRMFLTDTTINGETGSGADCALNNSLAGVADDDKPRARTYYPSIISPTLKSFDGAKNGVGNVSFKARLYSTTGVPDTAAAGRIVLYGSANSVDGEWTVLQTNYVTGSVFQDFTWETKRETFSAIKIEISDAAEVKGHGPTPVVDRVIIDEIVIGEKVQPSLSFAYVRPFRQNLMSREPIEDILSPDEQPLTGESWGVQTQLKLKQLTDEIDTDRGFEVYFTHFPGDRTWGYGNWKDQGSAPVKLVQVGEKEDLIFRSVGDSPESLVEPTTAGGTIVQYQVVVKYWNRAGAEFTAQLETKADWQQPDWYYPIDLNEQKGGYANKEKFSAYTVLDTVSPGRAWINEVNYNDGTADENDALDPPVDSQFIEICVPSGVDMTGWFLRLTDTEEAQWVMARFGDGERLPKIKQPTANELEGFEFVVVESPETNLAGGIRDSDGNHVEADGTWSTDGLVGTADLGTLSFARPFQFELVRPSGIVEHQFILGGTNTFAHKSYGVKYYGTNLLERLNESQPSPMRFYAGDDRSRTDDRAHLASAGVVTGAVGVVGLEPGGEDTWHTKLLFTPGRANVTQDGRTQTIPAGWFLSPNGTNAWVTLRVEGGHLAQDCGGLTNATLKIVVPQGATTNITYRADPWYELADLKVDGETVAQHVARQCHEYVYTLTPTSKFCEVVAKSGYDSDLGTIIDMDGPYAPSVVRWLAENWPDRRADEFRPAWHKPIGDGAEEEMSLLEMYFLDIPPFNDGNRERLWWFRDGILKFLPNQYVRAGDGYLAGNVFFTNTMVVVKAVISNAVSGAQYAPMRLQGRNYAKSDEAGLDWRNDDVSYQVQGMLNNGQLMNSGFLPFRAFCFDAGSFRTPETHPDKEPYTAVIEIKDPFSTESAGFGYGWSPWAGLKRNEENGFFFRSMLSTNSVPAGVELLEPYSVHGALSEQDMENL